MGAPILALCEAANIDLWSRPMLNGRLYRTGLVPVVFALAIAAFSLTSHPRPLTARLAPDAFQGSRALSELNTLAAAYPDRRPGSSGDQRLAGAITHELEGLGGTASGGFSVQTHRFSGQTIDGERSLSTIVATRPGSTSERPVAILAHRDAAAAGSRAAAAAAARERPTSPRASGRRSTRR
jgi:hypothetical protein